MQTADARAIRWLPALMLTLGCLLRIGLAIATPPGHAYDDHLEPTRIIVMEHRLPAPADCWSCYHPPLYYLVSAAVFEAVQGVISPFRFPPQSATAYGQKAIQFVSVAAGCLTLWICRLILRRCIGEQPVLVALGLAFVAFLPVHVRMSAMTTNDSLTYAIMTAAVWAALRADAKDWSLGTALLTGLLCGLGPLTKIYAWATVGAIWLFAAIQAFRRHSPSEIDSPRQSVSSGAQSPRAALRWRAPLLVVGPTILLGIWPHVRMMAIYGRPHVDNYEIRDTQQRSQPPGALAGISFYDLRLGQLLAHPWLHRSTLDSFWTELYARTWFEHVGFNNTLLMYKPWSDRRRALATAISDMHDRRFFTTYLDYDESVTPGQYRWIAQSLYVGGLPLTLAALTGLALLVRSAPQGGPPLLLVLNGLLCLCIPIVQTARLPVFAAMKIEFTLCALSTAAVAVAWMAKRLPRRGQVIVGGCLFALLAVVAIADTAFLFAVAHAAATPTP